MSNKKGNNKSSVRGFVRRAVLVHYIETAVEAPLWKGGLPDIVIKVQK